MRILMVSSCFGTYGGIEAFVLAIAKFLHQVPGIEVKICFKKVSTFLMTSSLQSRCVAAGIPFTFVERGGWCLWKEIGWADVIHAQNAPPDVILMAALRGKPLALTIHNWLNPANGWRSWISQVGSRSAAARWYNSRFVASTWEPPVMRNGSLVIPTVSELPTVMVPPSKRRGFVFASRWIPNKGIETLVEAYALAKLDPESWPLNLIGDGPLRHKVEGRIRDLGIQGIYLHGFLEESDKYRLMSEAKWLVAPPHTREDLGLTAIEARNIGVPCIITRDGGLPEAAGAEALICEPGDVVGLAQRLREASEMNELEYEERSLRTKRSLEAYLVPTSFYLKAYQALSKSKMAY